MRIQYYARLSCHLILIVLLSSCARLDQRAARNTAQPPQSTVNTNTQPVTGQTSAESLVSDGVTRQYRLHIPPSYQNGQSVPLVISLHGYSSNATQQEHVSQLSIKADSAGFIAVYPEGLGDPQKWHFGSSSEGQADVAFFRTLIQQLEAQFSIDPKRIYVVGISNGAQMSYRLACDLGGTIAAFGAVAGGYPPFTDCQTDQPISAIAFHGTADQLLPYEGKPPLLLPVRDWAAQWAQHNGCSATPTITLQHGDVTGESWTSCTNNADVVLYTIANKGHSWPGSAMPAAITTHDIDATDTIWGFFAAHPKK